MRSENDVLKIIDEILSSHSKNTNIGLLNGKTGLCLYYFILNRGDNDVNLAQNLLDNVISNLKIGSTDTTFATGLSGISWAIEFLIRNCYINGDPEEVVYELDNNIFKNIAYSILNKADFESGILGYLFYYLYKMQFLKGDSLSFALYEKVVVKLLNDLSDLLENNGLSVKPSHEFTVFWDLPICLFLLGRVYKLNIHLNKVDNILSILTPMILELRVPSNAYKLSLGVGLSCLLREVKDDRLSSFLQTLHEEFNIELLLNEEFRDKSLHFKNGLSGIYFLLWLKSLVSNESGETFSLLKFRILDRIKNSSFWDIDFHNIDEYNVLSSFDLGLSGIGISISSFFCTD